MGELKEFNLAALAEMDGQRIAIAVDAALKRCVMDCEDRPGEDKARKVVLNLELTPDMDVNGNCDNVTVRAFVNDTVPKRRTKKYNMSLRHGGRLAYQPDSLDNPEQDAFDFDPSQGE